MCLNTIATKIGFRRTRKIFSVTIIFRFLDRNSTQIKQSLILKINRYFLHIVHICLQLATFNNFCLFSCHLLTTIYKPVPVDSQRKEVLHENTLCTAMIPSVYTSIVGSADLNVSEGCYVITALSLLF